MERVPFLSIEDGCPAMTAALQASRSAGEEKSSLLRCAIYTRKSSEEGLAQAFNSLDC